MRANRSKQASLLVMGLASCTLLGACGGGETVQEALGYERSGPDEMAVIKRPPLILPPDYNLRPPRPGEPDSASIAASEAARQTLLGPSASDEASPSAGETPDGARAILTGAGAEGGESAADAASSAGQSLLVSRTNRVERDLDALAETRAENRVDGALLRRLLAWTPADRPVASEGDESGVDAGVVQVLSRTQTPIGAEPGPSSQTSAE